MDLSITHLLWTTIVSLIVSHLGANYLVTITPKGYWFWFSVISIMVGLLLM
ncbi:hypothetical protein HOO68_02595 [Candidatus Gracilibacteria bacterium]|nr:hypothetical protein [Candidatus Gracilibacteria bacterium]